MPEEQESLLAVSDLHVGFRLPGGEIHDAVQGVSFELRKGEALALAGASGSGKSVTALTLARLLPQPPAIISEGSILLDGEDVLKMGKRKLASIRGAKIAYVFQDPTHSLNPVSTVRAQMAEVLRLHRPDIKPDGHESESVQWLYRVGIIDPEKRLADYPHQLGDDMQQRIMIAMALSCQPALLVADEPTAALDVTIRNQILTLLRELKEEAELSILLLTHDFGIIGEVADRVAVMSGGKIVEQGETAQIVDSPQEDETRALLDAVPRVALAPAETPPPVRMRIPLDSGALLAKG